MFSKTSGYGGPQLTNIVINATNPPTCGTSAFNVWSDPFPDAKLYVPIGCYATYWSASVWQNFEDIIELDNIAQSIRIEPFESKVPLKGISLTAILSPQNTTIKKVGWTTSEAAITTVLNDSTIYVHTTSPEIIEIYAYTLDGSNLRTQSYQIEFYETFTSCESITLSQKSAELKPNEMLNITCTVLPETANDRTYTWASDNTSVAVVRTNSDRSATVLAVAPGIANISATTNDGTNLTDVCTIKVLKLAELISLDKTTATMNAGNTIDLAATVSPDDADNKAVVWSSSDETLVVVTDNGDGTATITATNPGVVTVTATTADGSGLSASCEITITKLAESITLDKTTASAIEGNIIELTATVLPDNTSDKTVAWSISDESIATLTDNGDGSATISVLKVGTATVTASTTDGSNLSATCEISGLSSINDISIDGEKEVKHYDVHGRLLSNPTSGINIIKMSDGTTRKEWVK